MADKKPTNRSLMVAELERIHRLKGRLEAAHVVHTAKSPSSPLHRYFEWDDSKAGHRYRIEQARELIRSVEVRWTVEENIIKRPQYVSQRPHAGKSSGYVKIEDIVSVDDRRDTAINELNNAISYLRRALGIVAAVNHAKIQTNITAKITEIESIIEDISRLEFPKKQMQSTKVSVTKAA